MKRRMIITIALTTLMFTCTVYATSILFRNEINPDYEKDEPSVNINEAMAGTHPVGNDIPVYDEDDLLFSTNGQFYLSRDANFYDGQNACQNYLGGILEAYPTKAIRKQSEDSMYLIYDTDTGYRLFLFSSGKDYMFTTTGFPIVIGKLLSYNDFDMIKKGDPIEKVASVDSVANLIKREILDVWNLDPAGAAEHYKEGYPCTSIHYLKNGILKIEYEMLQDRSLVVSNMVYNVNYELKSANGELINYIINEQDLPD